MDSLKTLIDQKKYDLVIKLTETSQTSNDLFYRISAFICLGKYEEALFVIQDHQKTLETNLASLINVHINLLCALARFDQAYSALDYYSNLPYQSQVVEEMLRKMPKVIEAEEHKQNTFKYYDDEALSNLLKSENDDEVLMALDIIKGRDVLSFLPELSDLLVSHKREIIKSYTLMLLVNKEVDRNLKINKLGKVIDVNPKKLERPFSGDTFNQVVRLFDSEIKDLTISQTATQLLSQYCIYIYPDLLNKNPDLYFLAFYFHATEYIDSPLSKEELEDKAYQLDLNLDELNILIKEIKKCLDNF